MRVGKRNILYEIKISFIGLNEIINNNVIKYITKSTMACLTFFLPKRKNLT